MNSFYSEFFSLIPKNKNVLIRFISFNFFLETSCLSSNINEDPKIIDAFSRVFDYDGFIFIEEPTGVMIPSLDEVHEKINLFGYHIRNNFICRFSKEEVQEIHKVIYSSFLYRDISKVFYYC